MVQCKGDADTSIPEKSMEYANEGKQMAVAADDTDVLALLMHHWHSGLADIFFTTEKKEKWIVLQKSWSVM